MNHLGAGSGNTSDRIGTQTLVLLIPHIVISNQIQTSPTFNLKISEMRFYFIEKQPHITWTDAVQTHIVQGSTVILTTTI